ncbi:MAG: transcriptional regulator [Crocinitomicaceae bacterium]|nr:transcriptional regulator [Crocinitomicaceae bacterium]
MSTHKTPVNGKALNGVNYIQHLTGFFEMVAQDNRLSMGHITLYMALFQFWNMNRFQNPVSICRTEVMAVSKIGSTNSYTKYLKELDKFGYIQYLPSFNPMKGSLVNLYNFDNATDKGYSKGSSKACGKGTNKGSEKVVRPSINSINNNKHINIKTIEGENSPSELSNTLKSKKMKIQNFTIPDLQEVKSYFLEKENTIIEAEKFYNYFESNGWLVGGKTKMKDWKAAARNWMLNAKRFAQPEPTTSSHLHVNENKRYDIPL